jgi:formate dehydrogenase-N gamma subunit
MKPNNPVVARHSYVVRVGHWLTALSFIVLTLSGMAFFFPSLRFLADVFGTPQLAQFLHPVFGLVMLVGLIILFLGNFSHALPEAGDGKWLANVVEVLKGHEHEVVEVGQYNAGQKILFWQLMGLFAVLLITGLIAWQPYFAPLFSRDVVRWCIFLHSVAAVLLILSIMIHAYMAFWYKGTMRGMIRGTVTRKWAKLHHPKWLREVEKAPAKK